MKLITFSTLFVVVDGAGSFPSHMALKVTNWETYMRYVYGLAPACHWLKTTLANVQHCLYLGKLLLRRDDIDITDFSKLDEVKEASVERFGPFKDLMEHIFTEQVNIDQKAIEEFWPTLAFSRSPLVDAAGILCKWQLLSGDVAANAIAILSVYVDGFSSSIQRNQVKLSQLPRRDKWEQHEAWMNDLVEKMEPLLQELECLPEIERISEFCKVPGMFRDDNGMDHQPSIQQCQEEFKLLEAIWARARLHDWNGTTLRDTLFAILTVGPNWFYERTPGSPTLPQFNIPVPSPTSW